MSDLQNDAITAALENNWEKAVELNTKIHKEKACDIDCLNRLAKAYLELGDNKKACLTLKKVLKIDKYDPIAQKNMAKAMQTGGKKIVLTKCITQGTIKINPAISFLEEPGKTKLISLVNLAPCHELLSQNQTDIVTLTPKRHTVVATDSEGNYLGSLPDDVGHRLSVLIKGGNKYIALIKSVSKISLIIFVRETVRVKRFSDTPSFITNGADYFSYIREDATHSDQPVVTETDGEDDAPTSDKIHLDEEPETV